MKNKTLNNLMIFTPLIAAAHSVIKSYSEYSSHDSSALIWIFILLEALLSLFSVFAIELIILGVIYNTVRIMKPAVRSDIENCNELGSLFKKVVLNSHNVEILGYILILNLYLYKNVDLELGYIHGIIQPLLAAILLVCSLVLIKNLIYFGASLVNLENVDEKQRYVHSVDCRWISFQI
ncbi:hypothetical protein ABMA79_07630 [Halobacteriovorax sp. HFRX-2_2]|uniref:hypothetical protein n=1 Tax=unclassified Halobacteriovorax TaxID=2639665 RepID=UPI0037100331